MSNHGDEYRDLRKKYTDEEIADFAILPRELSPDEETQAAEALQQFRQAQAQAKTEKDWIASSLMQLRAFIYDAVQDGVDDRGFGYFLKEYIQRVKRSQKDFATDINVHPSRLNRILKDKELPNLDLLYRLDEYSEGLIPFKLWWNLLIRLQEKAILQDSSQRASAKQQLRKTFSQTSTE